MFVGGVRRLPSVVTCRPRVAAEETRKESLLSPERATTSIRHSETQNSNFAQMHTEAVLRGQQVVLVPSTPDHVEVYNLHIVVMLATRSINPIRGTIIG